MLMYSQFMLITRSSRSGRSGGGGGGGRRGGGGGGGGGDYEVFEDIFFVQTPLQMGRLLSSIMARRAPDSHQVEPLLSLTLKNGTRVPVDISSPKYKRIRNVFYKRLLELANNRKLASLRHNRKTNNINKAKPSRKVNTETPNPETSNGPIREEIQKRKRQSLARASDMKMMPDGYNDVIEGGEKLKEYGNILEQKMNEERYTDEELSTEYDPDEPDLDQFTDYSQPERRMSMNRFAKRLNLIHKEPFVLDTVSPVDTVHQDPGQ